MGFERMQKEETLGGEGPVDAASLLAVHVAAHLCQGVLESLRQKVLALCSRLKGCTPRRPIIQKCAQWLHGDQPNIKRA